MSKADELNFLKDEFRTSFEWKAKYLHSEWADAIAEYKMRYPHKRASYQDFFSDVYNAMDDQVHYPQQASRVNGYVPLVNILVRKLVAFLTMREPYFAFENVGPGDEAIAYLLEQQMEDLLHKIQFRQTSRANMLDAALCGTGVIKVGYSSEFMYGEDAWSDSVPRGYNLGSLENAPYGQVTEYTKFNVKPGHPMLLHVPPQDIFLDPAARVWEEAGRFYHRSSRRVVDIIHDGRYLRKARAQVHGERPRTTNARTYPDYSDELENELRRSDVIECFDVASRQFCVFSNESEDFLRYWEKFDISIDHPYEAFRPIDNPGSPYGMPYAKLLLHSADSVNTLTRRVIEAIDRDGKTVYLTHPEMSVEMVANLNNAGDREFLQLELDDTMSYENIGDLIQKVEFDRPNPDVLALKDSIKRDMDLVSGFTNVTRGLEGGKKQTATEVATRQATEAVGTEDMRDQHEQFAERAVTKTARVMMQFWDEDKPIKVVGPDPRLYFWTKVERSRVLVDMSVRVRAGSTEKPDKVTMQRMIVDLMPHLMSMKQHIDQDAMNRQQGLPPSPVNLEALMYYVVELFDPRLADKILNRRDPEMVLTRLISQHYSPPTDVSPELIQLIQRSRMGQQGVQPAVPPAANALQFGQGQPGPGQQQPRPNNPQFSRDRAAFQSGRQLSEARR